MAYLQVRSHRRSVGLARVRTPSSTLPMYAPPLQTATAAPANPPIRGSDAPAAPDTDVDVEVTEETVTIHIPPYHVVLLDDDHHTYDYVIEMLMKLFGHGIEDAFRMACEVDLAGRVVVDTTTRERAELKRDQIHAYGPDWRIPTSAGSMSATIEPAE